MVPGVEGLADVLELKHGARLPSVPCPWNALPFQYGMARNTRHDQRRDELEVVGVQTKLERGLQHNVVKDRADGNGKEPKAEVDEDLAEHHLADDERRQDR